MDKIWIKFLKTISNGQILKEFESIVYLKTFLFKDLNLFFEYKKNNNLEEFFLTSNINVNEDLIEVFKGSKENKCYLILIKNFFELFEKEKIIEIFEYKELEINL